jgi:putative polyhydroxyalkanoate system protein
MPRGPDWQTRHGSAQFPLGLPGISNMSHIVIRRSHRLKTPELRKRAEALAQQLQDEYGGEYHWDGNTGHYSYAGGIDATLALKSKEIVIEAKLGLLMRMFSSRIEEEVNQYLDDNLA